MHLKKNHKKVEKNAKKITKKFISLQKLNAMIAFTLAFFAQHTFVVIVSIAFCHVFPNFCWSMITLPCCYCSCCNPICASDFKRTVICAHVIAVVADRIVTSPWLTANLTPTRGIASFTLFFLSIFSFFHFHSLALFVCGGPQLSIGHICVKIKLIFYFSVLDLLLRSALLAFTGRVGCFWRVWESFDLWELNLANFLIFITF